MQVILICENSSKLTSCVIHNEIMLDRRDGCLYFCRNTSESIYHSALLYFIVCLNTSPNGKLRAQTSMEKMTGSHQKVFWKEKKKSGQSYLQCHNWIFFISCPASLIKKRKANFSLKESAVLEDCLTSFLMYLILLLSGLTSLNIIRNVG